MNNNLPHSKPVHRLDYSWAEWCWPVAIWREQRFGQPHPVNRAELPDQSRSSAPRLADSRCGTRRSAALARTGHRGFTLVEMLVVIAIIAILASLLLPALGRAKVKAQVTRARADIHSLTVAIQGYATEYQRPPAVKPIEDNANEQFPDFTYGTALNGGGTLKDDGGNPLPYVGTREPRGPFEANNSVVMQILMARDGASSLDFQANANHTRNPRQHVFLTPKDSSSSTGAGLDRDTLVYRDPWGNPYIITVDLNDDNRCRDGYYSPVAGEISAPVAIWSMGPDGNFGSNDRLKGFDKDNVLSWK